MYLSEPFLPSLYVVMLEGKTSIGLESRVVSHSVVLIVYPQG